MTAGIDPVLFVRDALAHMPDDASDTTPVQIAECAAIASGVDTFAEAVMDELFDVVETFVGRVIDEDLDIETDLPDHCEEVRWLCARRRRCAHAHALVDRYLTAARAA